MADSRACCPAAWPPGKPVEDEEGLWRELSARLAVMEPAFYSVLHFILQGSADAGGDAGRRPGEDRILGSAQRSLILFALDLSRLPGSNW